VQGNVNQFAEYFINISIGTPPQILRVQIDSGVKLFCFFFLYFSFSFCSFFFFFSFFFFIFLCLFFFFFLLCNNCSWDILGSTDLVIYGTYCTGCPTAPNITYPSQFITVPFLTVFFHHFTYTSMGTNLRPLDPLNVILKYSLATLTTAGMMNFVLWTSSM
jgi:hypothetical protein